MLQDVYAEFVGRLGVFGRVVIAGGSVRDHMMDRTPKDYDVFVLGTQDKIFGPDAAKALHGLEPIKPLEFHKSEPFMVAAVRWHGVDVQVMATPFTTTDDLLKSFDWNVCLFAFDGSFDCREDIKNIKPCAALKLHTVTFPMSTLRRGFRFSERFLMELRRADILRLCKQIVNTKSAKKASPDV